MEWIHYLGHAGFEIGLGNTVVLIDPFFGSGLKERVAIETIKTSHIKRADVILLTHEHQSHADTRAVEEIAMRTAASVVAPAQTLRGISISDRQKVDVRVGDHFSLKGVDITVVKATHPQSLYPVGYVISNSVKIYHAGDTYQFNEMFDLNVDYALLPIGGSYTMDPIDAANATKMLRAKFIIPMHYNTYGRITQDVREFQGRVSRGKVLVLSPDDSIEIKK